ncbi:MAG: type III-A CRISPR-associated RAMP protein Csm5 [Bryobacterales bacterium]|nr:type III-A CRISPR-associated RAMP protein Csm5 [Bryobacterales bacterium]
MRYRLTCLTPVLAGDGRKLSPIDYMVWKDHVNVLDQRRIFRLLAKGPRLDGYLQQLKRAEKLDFASWGGFAQNFADRRIPFEHGSAASYWERSPAENLHIPTFAAGPQGPYLPGSALRGALRMGLVFAGLKEGSLEKAAAQLQGDRPGRRPGEVFEDRIVGSGGASRMRAVSVADSDPVSPAVMKIYLLRVASLAARSRAEGVELAWKLSAKGSVSGARPQESTPLFAEMASPGAVFEGGWAESGFLRRPEILKALNWRDPVAHGAFFDAANRYASALLESQKRYAEIAGLERVRQELDHLAERLAAIEPSTRRCLLCLGWGAGLLAHVAWLKTEEPAYRKMMEQARLLRSPYHGFPFPKTRRIVFLEDRPATLPGWALLEVD